MASPRPTSAEVFPDPGRPRYRESLAHRDLAGIVLAAGRGTRIAPLSARRPKPLLPIGLTTPLARAVEALRAGGIERVVVNASHRAADVVAATRMLSIEVVVEEDGPRGTAGGVATARAALDSDRVVVWNGDIVADVDVRALLAKHDANRAAIAVLAVRDVLPEGAGNVGLDAHGRVVRLRSQRFGDEDHGAWFAAVHVLGSSVVARAPDRGCLVADVYLPMLAEGAVIETLPTSGRWHDVGDLESYLAANLDLAGESGALVAGDAHVDDGVTLDRCVIGAGARVVGTGSLREVVVWPGVEVTAPRAHGVALDDGTFLPVPG